MTEENKTITEDNEKHTGLLSGIMNAGDMALFALIKMKSFCIIQP